MAGIMPLKSNLPDQHMMDGDPMRAMQACLLSISKNMEELRSVIVEKHMMEKKASMPPTVEEIAEAKRLANEVLWEATEFQPPCSMPKLCCAEPYRYKLTTSKLEISGTKLNCPPLGCLGGTVSTDRTDTKNINDCDETKVKGNVDNCCATKNIITVNISALNTGADGGSKTLIVGGGEGKKFLEAIDTMRLKRAAAASTRLGTNV